MRNWLYCIYYILCAHQLRSVFAGRALHSYLKVCPTSPANLEFLQMSLCFVHWHIELLCKLIDAPSAVSNAATDRGAATLPDRIDRRDLAAAAAAAVSSTVLIILYIILPAFHLNTPSLTWKKMCRSKSNSGKADSRRAPQDTTCPPVRHTVSGE